MHYKKDNLTVGWEPAKCAHSGICVKGLGQVFNPAAKPWINMDGADKERIVQQVKNCPSGALSFILDNDKAG